MTQQAKDVELEVRGRRIVVPGAIMTLILIGVTAGLFYLMESPDAAGAASIGFALLMLTAKAVDVNMSHVLTVLGKTEEDLPEGIEPLQVPVRHAAVDVAATDEEEPLEVTTRPAGKIRAFFWG